MLTLPTSSASSRFLTRRAVSFLPSPTRQWRRVDPDRHRQRRFVDGDDRQSDRGFDVGECLADRDLGDAGDSDEVARPGRVDRHAGELFGQEQFDDLGALDRAVGAAPCDLLALFDLALDHSAQRQAAQVRVGVEVGDPCLQRGARRVGRARDRFEDDITQRRQRVRAILDGDVEIERGPAVAARAVDDREVELVVAGVEVDEQFEDLVDDFGDAGVGSVDLVDHQDHGHVVGERLAQHEARLRQRTLCGVDQQHDAVDHGEGTLDLAAEVGVTGGVDDVQRDAAPEHRGVLGEDRDPLLALEVVRVHDPLVVMLVGPERSRLLQQRSRRASSCRGRRGRRSQGCGYRRVAPDRARAS